MAPPLKKLLSARKRREEDNVTPNFPIGGSLPNSDSSDEQGRRNTRPPSRVSFLLPSLTESTTTGQNTSAPAGKAKEGDYQTPQTKRSRVDDVDSVSSGQVLGDLARTSSSKKHRLLSEPLVDTPNLALYYRNLGASRSTFNTSPFIQIVRGVGRGAGYHASTGSKNPNSFLRTAHVNGPVPQQFAPLQPDSVPSLEWNRRLVHPGALLSLSHLNNNLDALASIALTPIASSSALSMTQYNNNYSRFTFESNYFPFLLGPASR